MNDHTFEEIISAGAPDVAAEFEAVKRGSCSGCGALWMPEILGGEWGVVIEHDDGCPGECPEVVV
ncbi:hypothetical protein DY023_06545 [Microbacterium bovistercoris]|uniref:Uncharacterized protein n=1 Tax=Microbacterium bovistercoris TaxID=2293570 RepID=A0A371NV87_9MICO|nr:hypothetical protein [Microbacterium bovistercoris]REJ06284.1 hypothetical protein DY023_06545 [Microbacterium bovistercoris]